MSQAKDTAASRLRYYRGLFLVKPLPGPRPKGADAPIGASVLFPHILLRPAAVRISGIGDDPGGFPCYVSARG